MPQFGALIAFTAGAVVVGLAFIWIARRTAVGPTGTASTLAVQTTRARWWGFIALLALAAVALVLGLLRAPYGITGSGRFDQESPALAVPITAFQYGWRGFPSAVPLDQPVRFELSSTDVNHGFAIYDPHDRIVGQVQAMPGYTNRLTLTFDRPGRYVVRCLELCGLYHHAMIQSFCAGDCPE